MGGFQPFLRAQREKNLTEGLGDVAKAHWQHTKRRLPWRPLPKRSETAQLFLNLDRFLAINVFVMGKRTDFTAYDLLQ